jgi:hypothetical protein
MLGSRRDQHKNPVYKHRVVNTPITAKSYPTYSKHFPNVSDRTKYGSSDSKLHGAS